MDDIYKDYLSYYEMMSDLNLNPTQEESEQGIEERKQKAKIMAEDTDQPIKPDDQFHNFFETNIQHIFQNEQEYLDLLSTKEVQNLTIIDKNKQETISGIKNYFMENQDSIIKSFEYAKSKLELSRKIKKKEEEVDTKLAKIFVSIYRVEPMRKCFADTTLSYHMFNMVKTNVIDSDQIFFSVFIKELAKIQLSDAKKFMIVNYSLFSERDFILSILDKLKVIQNPESKEFEKIAEDFSANMVFTITAYKNQTNYSRDLRFQSTNFMDRLVNCFFVSIKFRTMRFAKLMVNIGRTEMIRQIVAVIVNFLLGMIGFTGASPLLKIFLVNVFTVLINKILIFLTDLLKIGLSELRDFYTLEIADSVNLETTFLSSTDYEKLLIQKENDEQTTVDFSSSNSELLEQIYFDAANDQKSIYNQIEIFEIYKFTEEQERQIYKTFNQIKKYNGVDRILYPKKMNLINHIFIKKEIGAKNKEGDSKFVQSRKRDELLKKTLLLL